MSERGTPLMRGERAFMAAFAVASTFVGGLIGYEIGQDNAPMHAEVVIVPTPEQIIAKQLTAGESVRYFNGSITQKTAEGIKDYSDPLIMYKNPTPKFDALDINSYRFFTIRHTNGIPEVKEIHITPDMQLNGPTDPSEPVVQEAFLEPFQSSELASGEAAEDAHNYAVVGFAGRNSGKGGTLFVGTETTLVSGK